MTKILFVCSANIDRSPTAEQIYADHPGLEVKSAGTSWYARMSVNEELIQWAEVILCMENWQQWFIQRKYADLLTGKTIAHLGVPDKYGYMDPGLVAIIREKADAWLNENLWLL